MSTSPATGLPLEFRQLIVTELVDFALTTAVTTFGFVVVCKAVMVTLEMPLKLLARAIAVPLAAFEIATSFCFQ